MKSNYALGVKSLQKKFLSISPFKPPFRVVRSYKYKSLTIIDGLDYQVCTVIDNNPEWLNGWSLREAKILCDALNAYFKVLKNKRRHHGR